MVMRSKDTERNPKNCTLVLDIIMCISKYINNIDMGSCIKFKVALSTPCDFMLFLCCCCKCWAHDCWSRSQLTACWTATWTPHPLGRLPPTTPGWWSSGQGPKTLTRPRRLTPTSIQHRHMMPSSHCSPTKVIRPEKVNPVLSIKIDEGSDLPFFFSSTCVGCYFNQWSGRQLLLIL